MKRVLHHLVLTLILIATGFSAVAQKNDQSADTLSSLRRMELSKIGKSYPAFNFKSTRGKTFNSDELRNKTIVIDCWFETCHPCMAEVDALNELSDSLRDHSNIVFFTLARERESDIDRILREKGIRYPVVTNVDEAYKFNLNSGFPTKIIVDRNGIVAYYHGGGSPKKDAARKYIFEEFYPKILEIASR